MALTRYFFCITMITALWMAPSRASADVYNLSPADDWFSILSHNQLQPGDEVILAGGVYSDNRKLKMWQQGTADNPIIIRSAEGERAVITRPNASQNVINIEGGQHLVLRGLEVTGGSAGIRLGGGLAGQPNAGVPSRFVTIEDSIVHGVGDVAISANNPGQTYEGMIFRRNEIFDTGGVGEAYYLGCNFNACQFFDGLIEGNYIHDLDGPRVSQGDGVEIKLGSYNNVVRDNVIHDVGFPGILAYGTEGNGGPNIIEGNLIWGSRNQGIQVASDAIVRNNVVFNNRGESMLSQNHQGATPGNLTIVNNTFVSDSQVAIRVANPATDSIVIANNAIYSRTNAVRLESTENITLSSNVGFGRTSPALDAVQYDRVGQIATDFVDVDWRGPGINAFPVEGSALIDAADPLYLQTIDFNGTLRDGSREVGAYVFSVDGNPGWIPTAGFKRMPIAGDFDGGGTLDLNDIDLISEAVRTGDGDAQFDLNRSGNVDLIDRDVWIRLLAKTWYGDADLDGLFDSSDLTSVLDAGKYEIGTPAGWADGDWDGDGFFDSHDLVIALQGGGFESGIRASITAHVPEPSCLLLCGLAGMGLQGRLRRRAPR